MDIEEAKKIATEIEQDETLSIDENDLTEEELAQLEAEDEEDSFEEDEEDEFEEAEGDEFEDNGEREIVQVTETVNIVKQPIITSVMCGAEVDSKGTVRPVCKVSIERHIDPETVETDEFDIISDDFEKLAGEVKSQIMHLKDVLN